MATATVEKACRMDIRLTQPQRKNYEKAAELRGQTLSQWTTMHLDEHCQGMDLGAQLLRDAILNSLKVAELAGARALVVDPTGETVSAFYRCFGFSYLSATTRMVLRLL